MRQRRTPTGASVPAHLAAFHAREWAGTPADRWSAWHRARLSHYAADPDAWPDVVTLLVESYDVRRAILTDR